MRKYRKKSNKMPLVGLIVFALVVFALVPVVGDWILSAILPTEGTQGSAPSTQTSAGDVTPPAAQAKQVLVNAPGKLNASDFVTEIVDASAVTVTFVTEPDWNKEGSQEIQVLLTDAAGNTTTVTSSLVLDKQAPVITGAKKLETYVGGTVSYKAGVSVTDNLDTKPTLEIDNSQVDMSKPGNYSVIYTAKDAIGNTQTVTVTLTVKAKPDDFVEPEVIYKRVDDLLAKFITDDMTDREKAEAVYVWTRRGGTLTPQPGHFTYSGSTSRHDDYLQAAYEFLQLKKGDCFYFYAIQKLMLERLNIPTIDVTKVKNSPEDTNHYWLLVSIDGGKNYYHYDNVWSPSLCLVTDSKLNSVSASVDSNPFNRNEALYPATPTQALPESELPWNNPAILAAKP